MNWMNKAKELYRLTVAKVPKKQSVVQVPKKQAVAQAPKKQVVAQAPKKVQPQPASVPKPSPSLDYEPDLLAQVRQAHTDWVCAQQRLNYAVDKDQIDYAVYSLEAAEKRYSMLLKQAKAANLKANAANTLTDRNYMRVTG